MSRGSKRAIVIPFLNIHDPSKGKRRGWTQGEWELTQKSKDSGRKKEEAGSRK
jgi:hypothetical protein